MVHYFKVLSAIPTLDTAAYATGDRMGSLVTVSNVLSHNSGDVKIISVNVIDKAKQNAAFDIMLFSAAPTIASADNAPLDISDAEIVKLCGVIPIATTDYTASTASNSQATKTNIQFVCELNDADNSLYMLLVSRGSPTYAASDLVIKIGIEVCQS